jgi:WD40 repeat protein
VASDKIVRGSRDTCVKVWSSTSYRLLATLRGHIGSVLCVKADADNGFLASGSSDGELLIWNLDTLENTSPVHKISAHHENVLEVILSADYIFSRQV